MKRTALKDRPLPTYTVGEERFHTVSHIVGGGFGVLVLVGCVLRAALNGDVWGVVSGAVYGSTLVLLYTVSSVYHGLSPSIGKRVLQVLDHCVIYALIAGTYTPIVLGPIRRYSPGWGWALFGLVWGLALLAATFTAIDLKKYAVLSMVCYIGMGWCIVVAAKPFIASVSVAGVWWIFLGGVAYTVGAVLYGWGRTKRWMHAAFHTMVVVGSVLQAVGIFFHVL